MLVQSRVRDAGGTRVILIALAFGLALIASVGFASACAIHDAVHDVRQATGLSCH
ncbi:CbtB domain-containing protein [Loktanella sp. M215]|uniref:CbtB domain-containing protein n=1 Tax=Loktanella sp. M215 TaxID=2675431 RepID=UPI001F920DE9|nr:CbtB domain-containing protein [Loktanella sp. M215]MCF7702432.1 CbtB-domain containing protein [Loktanella sp. M215]